MKRLVLLFSVFVLVFGVRAGESARAKAARQELTQGVRFINSEGLPGPVLCTADDAFPVGECQHWEGTYGFAAAGAFYGEGRGFYFGHDAYLAKPFKADTARLLKNVVNWLAKGKADPKVTVVGKRAILTQFAAIGVKAGFAKTYGEALDSDVIVCGWVKLEDVPMLLDYVKKGGGVVGASCAWGWKQIVSGAGSVSIAKDFGFNQLFGPMGVLAGDMGTRRPGDGGYPVLADYPEGSFTADALDLMLGERVKTDKQLSKQCSKIVSLTLDSMPTTSSPDLMAKLKAFADQAGNDKIPTPQDPITPGDLAARLAQIVRKNTWQADPVKCWPADPAHTVYPGACQKGYRTVTKNVSVDLSRKRWHGTGLYSPAGEPLTVTLPAGAEKLGLALRIGTTKEDVTSKGEWRRAPVVSVQIPLKERKTTLSTPYGGLVYLVVPNEAADGKVEVGISGAIAAPWFRLGRDTNETFARQLAETFAPMGELEGEEIVITLPVKALKPVEDPTWIVRFWDRVISSNREFAQEPRRNYTERACGDVQLEGGDFHNGYPFMFHLNGTENEGMVMKSSQTAGLGWGFYHELGHNFQSHDWTPDGMSEVTVNLFTCHVIEKICGHSMRERRYGAPSTAEAEKRVNGWIAGGKSFDGFKRNPFLALEPYLRFAEAFGWEVYPKVFAEYRKPGAKSPKDNQEKWDLFAERLSAASGRNCAKALKAWSVPISGATEKACAQYPDAPASITVGVDSEYVGDAPFETEDAGAIPTAELKGEYLGVSLVDFNRFETYANLAAVPGGDQDCRWKTDWLLLRRIDPPKAEGSKPSSYSKPPYYSKRPYYLGVYEVTQQQYAHIAGEWAGGNFGSVGTRETRPVQNISYNVLRGGNWPQTGLAVCNESVLARLRGLTGFRLDFDLPTSDDWEYACRAGTTGDYNRAEPLEKLGRFAGNGDETAPVGSYLPNAWGFYDMHGNVSEQCIDSARCKAEGRRVARGGSYKDLAEACTSSCRTNGVVLRPRYSAMNFGFRLWVDSVARTRPCAMNGTVRLAGEAAKAREELVRGMRGVTPGGLASPLAVSDGAFPVLAGNNFDKGRKSPPTQGVFAAAAFYGKGRVVVAGDKAVLGQEDNAFTKNVRAWLGANGEVRTVDLEKLEDKDVAELQAFVRNGGGLFAAGAFWKWQADLEEETGVIASPALFPGNRLLKPTGIQLVDMGLAWDAADGFAAKSLFRRGVFLADAEKARAARQYADQLHERQVAQTLRFVAEAKESSATTNRPPASTRVLPPPYPQNPNGGYICDGDKIVFLGDSITRLGAGKNGWIDQVMAGLAAAGIKDVESIRAGCDGNNSSDMLGRLGGLISQPGVNWIVLSCGVNDAWGFTWRRPMMLADYKRNMREILDRCAKAKVNVAWLTPTFVGEDPDNELNRILKDYVAFIRKEAKSRGILLVDMNRAEAEGLARAPMNGKKVFTYDGVHPVEAGHRLFSETILLALLGRRVHGDAQVELPTIFSPHMVLPCGRPVPVWGRAVPGAMVKVSFGAFTGTTLADGKGNWSIDLPAMEPSEEGRTLKVNQTTFEDVLVGDVYIVTGCSTRFGPYRKAKRPFAEEQATAERLTAVRVVDVHASRSEYPDEGRAYREDFLDRGRGWHALADRFSELPVVTFEIASGLYAKMKRPVGIIRAVPDWGSIELLLPADSFRKVPELSALADKVERTQPTTDLGRREIQAHREALTAWEVHVKDATAAGREIAQKRPELPTLESTGCAIAYNAMIHPIRRYPVTGVVWADAGVWSDRGNAAKAKALKESWNALWGYPLTFDVKFKENK